MEILVVTEPQAREMQTAIEDFQAKDSQVIEAQNQADLGIALAWFNTQGINIQAAVNRNQALDNFNQIKLLLQTETDPIRKGVLREKLQEANEKFKERKRNG